MNACKNCMEICTDEPMFAKRLLGHKLGSRDAQSLFFYFFFVFIFKFIELKNTKYKIQVVTGHFSYKNIKEQE